MLGNLIVAANHNRGQTLDKLIVFACLRSLKFIFDNEKSEVRANPKSPTKRSCKSVENVCARKLPHRCLSIASVGARDKTLEGVEFRLL